MCLDILTIKSYLLRSTSNASLILFLCPVSFELVCLYTVRNESSRDACADARTPNWPPRLIFAGASLGWETGALVSHLSSSLIFVMNHPLCRLASGLSIMLFKSFVGCIYRSLRELCRTLQFAVLLVSRLTRNTPTFAVCRNVSKLKKKTVTLRVVWLSDKNWLWLVVE